MHKLHFVPRCSQKIIIISLIQTMSALFDLNLPLGHAANTVPDGVTDNFRTGGDDDDDSVSSLCMGTKKRKIKFEMSDGDLLHYFETKLNLACCPTPCCTCLQILCDRSTMVPTAYYLVWFERKSKYDQDMIIMQWIIYGQSLPRSKSRWFHLPYDGSHVEVGNDGEPLMTLRSHFICIRGVQCVMGIGRKRYASIRHVSLQSAILPLSGNHGVTGNNAIKDNDPRLGPLKFHLDYLLSLGEVRATRVVATLVDGIQGHANRDDTVDMVYLPISMGFRSCYKRYMHSLGFKTRSGPDGRVVVDGIDNGKPIDHGYVSFYAYYSKWKKDYPQLKVSRPAEDICQYCYVFAN